MDALYKAKALAIGGRAGNVTVLGSPLAFTMALPTPLGGNGKGINPEQLFAAGYASCFGSALLHAIKARKLNIKTADIAAEVSIGNDVGGGFALAVNIVATISDVDQATADVLVNEAHQICPYSKATRGNIPVTVSAVAV